MSEEVDTTISILESYHQKGGTYVIPVEVINDVEDLLAEQENIIKEVREYIMSELITEWDIKNDGYVSGSDLPADTITKLEKDIEQYKILEQKYNAMLIVQEKTTERTKKLDSTIKELRDKVSAKNDEITLLKSKQSDIKINAENKLKEKDKEIKELKKQIRELKKKK